MQKLKFRLSLDYFAILALVFIVMVFLWRGATMQGVFFGADEVASDLVHFSYPYREYNATEYLKHGKVALWNSYIGAGMPVLGEEQIGVFYPPAMLLFYFLPVPVAFNYLIIVNFLLVAIGTYLFARTVGLSAFSSFFAALVFCLSGYMVGHLRHVPILSAAAFGPLIFWAAERLFLKPGFQWAALLSLFVAISIFGGHLPTTYIILFVLTIYFVLKWYLNGYTFSKAWPILAFFCGSILLSLGLSAVQLLPILELIPYSSRVLFNYHDAVSVSYKLKHLIFFVAPYFSGDPSNGTRLLNPGDNFWENVSYIGIIPLILAIFAIGRGFGLAPLKVIIPVLFFTLFLTLGQHTFLFKFFWDVIPGFDKIRISGRFLFFVDFFLAILAGFALKSLGEKIRGKYLLFVFGTITLITLFDLFRFGFKFNTVISTDYFSPPESVKIIQQDRDLYRIQSFDQTKFWLATVAASGGWRGDLRPYFWHREILSEDYNLLFRLGSPMTIYAAGGHFIPERSRRIGAEIFSHSYFAGEVKMAKLLGAENVKYAIFERDLGQVNGMEFVKKINQDKPGFTTYLYKNNEWLPRAYMVGRYKVLEPDEILESIFKDDFEPSDEVFLEKDPNKAETDGKGQVKIKSYSDEVVDVDVKSDRGGFLVLTDTYYPGWKAYIDGKETEIFRANYAYRAVSIDSGTHNVIFKYKPKSYERGRIISIASVVVLLSILIISKKYYGKAAR